ncbi:hypothetical protein Acr_07g0011150 [Actinidia rufa]|uniref:Uncharacterized protein n=1 Tax=Actinidia rufa TaxID=165716 RepID=A0A7J0EY77_9ERIC|nr:hypothetical protein Acr_07g0011150 [Actinidia rufa]
MSISTFGCVFWGPLPWARPMGSSFLKYGLSRIRARSLCIGSLKTMLIACLARDSKSTGFSFRFLNCPSPLVGVPMIFSPCLTSSSNRANISTQDMRSRRLAEGLSISTACCSNRWTHSFPSSELIESSRPSAPWSDLPSYNVNLGSVNFSGGSQSFDFSRERSLIPGCGFPFLDAGCTNHQACRNLLAFARRSSCQLIDPAFCLPGYYSFGWPHQLAVDHDLARGSTLAVLVSGWLIRPCLYGVAGSLPSTVDVSIWMRGLSEGTLSCKLPSVPCHPLGLSPVVAPHPSFQRSYYFELAKKRHLEGNDGLSLGGHSSVVVTSPSSYIEGLRARSMATVG